MFSLLGEIILWVCIIGIEVLIALIMLFIDVFTLPLFIILYLLCWLLKWKRPVLGNFYLIVYPSWKKRRASETSKMTGLQYEQLCTEFLRKEGYRDVEVTPATGDFGADIVAVDKHGQKWVFQCKHYKSKLGNKPVQEVVGAKSHYGATNAGVITNSVLTDKARQLARENGVKLYEHMNG